MVSVVSSFLWTIFSVFSCISFSFLRIIILNLFQAFHMFSSVQDVFLENYYVLLEVSCFTASSSLLHVLCFATLMFAFLVSQSLLCGLQISGKNAGCHLACGFGFGSRWAHKYNLWVIPLALIIVNNVCKMSSLQQFMQVEVWLWSSYGHFRVCVSSVPGELAVSHTKISDSWSHILGAEHREGCCLVSLGKPEWC